MTPEEAARLERLLNALTKPVFVWRMASNNRRKGSDKAKAGALQEAARLIGEFSA